MTMPFKHVLLAATVLALGACASKVDLEKQEPAAIESRGDNAGGAGADSRNVAPVSAAQTDPLNDPKGALAKRSVYFDFDSFEVKSDYRELVEAHAKFLRDNKGRKVSLEGNADERGSREYNLALGQKRSESVRRAMALLGVAEAQVEAVSFGEEKPRATGHDEAAWAENRRVDIRYQ